MSYWLGYFLILFLASGTIITFLILLHRTKVAYHHFFENLLLVVLALFLAFMGLEFYFKVFFAQPDAFDTLARDNWRQWYANKQAFNSFGYRDREWTEALVAGKTKVMIVGDSFVFGDGIEKPADRFPDRLARMLSDDYVVFNLGKGGTNTKHHIEAILNYPYAPDILVLSYFVNDVKGAALERQWMNRPRGPNVLPSMPLLVNNSYAFNFVYWRLTHILAAREPDTTWEWYLDLYNDPDSWWLHQQQLLTIYEGARSEQIPFLIVVFPSMDNIDESRVITERIVNLFRQKNVPTLDVAELIKTIPKERLMASPTDSHPSEFVHALVADALYEMLEEQGLGQ